MAGISLLGVAFSGYLLAPLTRMERLWIGMSSLLFIAPGLMTMAIGTVLVLPIAVLQYMRSRA